MALSGSYDFTVDRDTIITQAMLLCGAVSSGQTPTADEITDASTMLNLMLKSWMADGLQLFTQTHISATPVADQYKYTFGAGGDIDTTTHRPEEIFSVRRRLTSDTTDIELQRLSRDDYFRLAARAATGVPTQWYLEPAIATTGMNLYVWPAPDSTFAAGSTLEIIYQKPFDDMDASTNNLAFPQTWELAIVTNLAAWLSIPLGLSTTDRRELREVAAIEKRRVMEWDNEHTSLFIVPRIEESFS